MRLLLPVAARRFRDEAVSAGMVIVPVHDEHAIATDDLALAHADPFDRLLLATAIVEALRLATCDAALVAAASRDPALPVLAV